jgi:hypothetical protein
MCMYHHCVSVAARFTYLQRPFPRFIGRVCHYAAPPASISAAPSFFIPATPPPSKLPFLDVLFRSATASPVRGGAVSPLRRSCGRVVAPRVSCLQYHRTFGAADCAGIERLIRSCSDFEVACHRNHSGVSVPLRDLRRVRLLLVACMAVRFHRMHVRLGCPTVTAAGCSPGSHS